MGYKVGLTEAACDDLGAAVRFLAEKSPEVALRLGNELCHSLTLAATEHRMDASRCSA